MNQMWAPWRMEYIGGMQSDGCFLCEMFAQNADRENFIVRRGKLCAVVMNRYPYSNGHLMVASYRHLAELDALGSEERAEMMEWVTWCSQALKQIMQPQGFNVGINQGSAAGAGLKDHLHMHIVPRWQGDTNFMPVLGEVKVIPQSLEKVWQLLHDIDLAVP